MHMALCKKCLLTMKEKNTREVVGEEGEMMEERVEVKNVDRQVGRDKKRSRQKRERVYVYVTIVVNVDIYRNISVGREPVYQYLFTF